MSEVTANYDDPWKEAIGEYFDYFLEFFFPEVYNLIDWLKKPVSLEQELQKIIADSNDSKRAVDKLFKVWLKNQKEIWVLVHIEVQSQSDKDFAQRMYIYNYRAFDLYRKPVISLAVLGDENQSWRPNNYSYNLGGCQVNLAFPTVKLLDYEAKWEELESEQNPFAIMIMAHLKTKATTSNLSEREQWKWIFIRSLYEKGYQKKDIVKFLKFVDLMMTLPKQLQQSLRTKIKNYEEERKMPLVSNFEKIAKQEGKEEGLQEGIQQERLNLILRQLTRKLNQLSPELDVKIKSLSLNSLETLAEDLLDFNSQQDLISWLDNHS
jgi:hypothetical protein